MAGFLSGLANMVFPSIGLGRTVLGNATDLAGRALSLPDYGISEKLAGGNTLTTSMPSGYANKQPPIVPQAYGANIVPATTGSPAVLSATTNNTNRTSSFSPTQASTPTTQPDPSVLSGLDILKSKYDVARNGLTDQLSALNGSFNTNAGALNGYLTDAQTTAQNQKSDINSQFGNILADQLRTYQDLNRQRQGMFANLGTLDSSAFGEQQLRADQGYGQDRTAVQTDQAKQISSIDQALSSYQKQVNTQLSALNDQYTASKNAIKQALAQGNVEEAAALQDQIDQINAQAQQIQSNMANWDQQAAILKAQGVDVGNQLRSIVGPQLSQANANKAAVNQFGSNLIGQLLKSSQSNGFTGRSGKQYASYADALAAGDA